MNSYKIILDKYNDEDQGWGTALVTIPKTHDLHSLNELKIQEKLNFRRVLYYSLPVSFDSVLAFSHVLSEDDLGSWMIGFTSDKMEKDTILETEEEVRELANELKQVLIKY